MFRKKCNRSREPMWFEVVDISSLGMKLPGPLVVIIISGCFKKSTECMRDSSKLAEALVIAEEKMPAPSPRGANSARRASSPVTSAAIPAVE
jgi:hypothetical protein